MVVGRDPLLFVAAEWVFGQTFPLTHHPPGEHISNDGLGGEENATTCVFKCPHIVHSISHHQNFHMSDSPNFPEVSLLLLKPTQNPFSCRAVLDAAPTAPSRAPVPPPSGYLATGGMCSLPANTEDKLKLTANSQEKWPEQA